MTLADDDQALLRDLCEQQGVSMDKVLRLLQTIREYEFKDRRTGVYDALREILKDRSPGDGVKPR